MIEIIYVIFGALIFLVPGYLLSLIIYPGREDLDPWERVGTSIGLGALIVVLTVTLLAQPGIRALQFLPFLAVIVLFCVVCVFLIYQRGDLDRLSFLLEFYRRLSSKKEPVGEEPTSEE
ncbi:hypothetical protein AKJ58_01030 [candidate division MSBL1 archaeon SCGC-AAA385D11]|uniref:Uncharacterized protein n=1 Tax=candidate division MSBL1 archaeon SCGC-AAA385D11 TaxID=1698286 RepID=A0A133VNS6_9EURY|nr:hypothetical protein AKJ58_01030 [candidate division MSBL1 archaeon SCGC-AAA385D11]